MNDEIKKLVEQIVAAIPEKLTAEQIEKITSQCALLNQRPEIKITSDPKEFETTARERKTVYNDPWVGKEVSSIISSTLYGDYEQSDFSINKMQIALVEDINNVCSAQLVIYVPKKRDYDVTNYKDFIKSEMIKSLCDSIKSAAKGMLTSLEINKFLEQYDFSKGMPEIQITSDPREFDSKAKERSEEFVDSLLELDDDLKIRTKTLYGDYQPGVEDIYEYEKTKSSPYEESTPSDFSLSKVQVALVTNTRFHSFHGKEEGEETSTIVIYLPDEKEYGVDSFKQLTEKKHDVSEVQATVLHRKMGDIRAIMGLYNKKHREDEQK